MGLWTVQMSGKRGLRSLRLRRQRRVHFLHIGKTGGMALREALVDVDPSRLELVLHGHDFVLDDVPVGDGFFFATRDPLSRFVSGFYSRQRRGQPRTYSEWTPGEAVAFERFSTANELAEAIGTPAGDQAMRSIEHVRDSYWSWFGSEERFRERSKDLMLVLRQERLDADFAVLATLLGVAASLPSDPILAHRNPDGVAKVLSASAIDNLRAWYADDYRFLDLVAEVRATPGRW